MANVPSVNSNQLRPKQQGGTPTSKKELHIGGSQATAKAQQAGTFEREDTLELSAEAREILIESRHRNKND